MKFSLKQLMTAGALLAVSATAFADVSVPAEYASSSAAPDGATTNTSDDGGLVFYLFNTGDSNYSLTYYLGLDLSEVSSTQMDESGLTLTWTIDTSLYSGLLDSTAVWGVNAANEGSQSAAGSTSLVTTFDSANESASASATNTAIINGTTNIDRQYNGANEDAAPEDVNTTAYNSEDVNSNIGLTNGMGDAFDWTASASDSSATLEMYYYAQNGGRGQGDAEAISTKYAGVWSFDASTGTLTYKVAAVPVPAALWLLLSGLGGLGVVSRRRVAA